MVVAWDLSESGKSMESSRCWQINSHDNYSIEILANYSIEMVEDLTISSHLLSGLNHLENSGYMGFVGVKQNSGIWQMLVDKNGRGMSILAETFEQLMLP